MIHKVNVSLEFKEVDDDDIYSDIQFIIKNPNYTGWLTWGFKRVFIYYENGKSDDISCKSYKEFFLYIREEKIKRTKLGRLIYG